MQFVPIAGGVLDLPVLMDLRQKVGSYVVLINDLTTAGRRAVYAVVRTFRAARKLWEGLGSGLRATVYALGGVVELASAWQGVVWKKNPTFNGQ